MALRSPSGRTLTLTWPFGRTVLLAALLLALAAGAAEGVARVPAVQTRLTLTSTDNPNPDFDQLLFELDQHVAQHGPLDCVVIGSSLATVGFSADEFSTAYAATGAGDPPNCFNFGLAALVAQQAGPLARLLVALYHPRWLIFATSARDFSPNLDLAGYTPENDLTRGAWVRYRLGEGFSLTGWLVDNSRAYRAALDVRRALLAGPLSRAPLPSPDLTLPPDPVQEDRLFGLLANYQPTAAGLAGLQQVLALQAEGASVYVVEMPVHPTYLAAFTHGAADLALFRTAVQQPTMAAGATFWSAELELSLSDGDFDDRHHLSAAGRSVFSSWLAGKLAVVP